VLYGEIASGGMATVHFGRLLGPAGFARPVAIKRLHAQFARDPDFVKMFFDEARLAARIAHTNVVSTLDVVSADEEVFLVMEYVPGTSLAQLVRTVRRRGERIAPLVGVGVVSGMLHGLHAAHEARNDRGERLDLVHRDVSPQNVLVGTDGIPRLLDFGVAKASGRLQTTRDGQLKGKLAYMAPEQVRGEPLTRRTDVYAASVVLWEVLTGKRLFYAENEATVLSRVLSAEVAPPSTIVPELPRSLDRVVLRGLERDPEKRYPTARAMAADLETCIGVASATEIGDWVEETARDELRERALHIQQIERAAAEAAEGGPVAANGGANGLDASAPLGKRSRDSSSVWGNSQATRNERIPLEPSQVSSMSLARASEPPARPSRKLVSAIVASASAVLLVVAFLLFSQTRGKPDLGSHVQSTQPPVRSTAAASASVSAPPPVASATAEPTVVTNVDDLPVAAPLPDASTAAPPPASKAQWQRGPAAPPPSADDCNPPYTADAKGHIHFKPNCM
jgi:serine/threonine protein kinase